MKRIPLFFPPVIAIFLLTISFASAHEGRSVGPYEIEVGWRVEPAYTTLLNGPEFKVTHEGTDDPVADADLDLSVVVTLGPATKTLSLHPADGKPGIYTADLIPMRPGDYTFRLSGTIDSTSVDETFSSSEGQFSTVEPVTDIQFPAS